VIKGVKQHSGAGLSKKCTKGKNWRGGVGDIVQTGRLRQGNEGSKGQNWGEVGPCNPVEPRRPGGNGNDNK